MTDITVAKQINEEEGRERGRSICGRHRLAVLMG
jgi:hypothetical protein